MEDTPGRAPLEATLALTSACPHCAAMLALLADLVKGGRIAELKVVNLDLRPECAGVLGIRSVPWLSIGPFVLTGVRGRDELIAWIGRLESPHGIAGYLHEQLKEGRLDDVIEWLERRPDALGALLPILANPEASLNVRLGAGAVFEHFATRPSLAALVPELGEFSAAEDARVRADACHVLGLTGHPDARPWLEARRSDADAEVREIALESLERLQGR